MDPFGRINPKARKVIESVERQRQTPADPRAGSTGGSFDDDIDFGKLQSKVDAMQNMNNFHMFNHTAQNFYSQNDRVENLELIAHQRNISTGMKAANQKGGHSNMNSPLGNHRQQIYLPGSNHNNPKMKMQG